MSRHILYNLFPVLKSLVKPNSPNILTFLGTSIVLTYGHGLFALGTNKIEEISITKKYKYVSNGYTNFMIVDDKGRHFNINNSFWYWKWNSIEDWSSIKENSTINAKFYGWRVPLFGIFPNIVNSTDYKYKI
jgi:hypothetical protein